MCRTSHLYCTGCQNQVPVLSFELDSSTSLAINRQPKILICSFSTDGQTPCASIQVKEENYFCSDFCQSCMTGLVDDEGIPAFTAQKSETFFSDICPCEYCRALTEQSRKVERGTVVEEGEIIDRDQEIQFRSPRVERHPPGRRHNTAAVWRTSDYWRPDVVYPRTMEKNRTRGARPGRVSRYDE